MIPHLIGENDDQTSDSLLGQPVFKHMSVLRLEGRLGGTPEEPQGMDVPLPSVPEGNPV